MTILRSLTILFLLLLSTAVFAIEDTPGNRASQVDRYFMVMPPKDLFQDLAKQMSLTLDAGQREAFMAALTRNLDFDAVVKAMKDSMVKNFTADELAALADFYGSPVAKSAMKKFGPYMAETMPVIQAEVAKAVGKTTREFGTSWMELKK